MSKENLLFNFSIDRGGTFTDIYVEILDKESNQVNKSYVYKLLSEDKEYGDGPKEGIRRILEKELETEIPLNSKIPGKQINSLRMGTTVATNALLERKGAKTALLVTKGFRDLLYIGNQTRPDIFDLSMAREKSIFEEVVEIDERIRIINPQEIENGINYAEKTIFQNDLKEYLEIIKSVNKQKVMEQLNELKEKGIEALSIVLMHSPSFSDHEKQIYKYAKDLGFKQISLSHEVMPMIKIVPRGFTTTLDAYLNPVIHSYLTAFTTGFDEDLKFQNIFFMQSDGGLAAIKEFRGSRSILSGPAGGSIGYAQTSKFLLEQQKEKKYKGIIGFDMGGTSTDVSTYDGVQFEHIFDAQIAGVQINTPHLDINTVAAGGGSKLSFYNGIFKVGPESVGALPGPVCYGHDGQLAVTDANLILGRVNPKYFPKIFGPKKNEPLFKDLAIKKFQELTDQINKADNTNLTIYEVAQGYIKVANESMCRPIRTLTQGKGSDPRNFILNIFGGAGAQHACAVAKNLGIKEIFIHEYSGVLSAFGLARADVVQDNSHPFQSYLNEGDSIKISKDLMHKLQKANTEKLKKNGFEDNDIKHFKYLSLLYEGTDTSIMVLEPEDGDFQKAFQEQHQQEFGFLQQNKRIKIESVRVRSTANKSPEIQEDSLIFENYIEEEELSVLSTESVYFENYEEKKVQEYDCKVYEMKNLQPSSKINGPAIIINETSTIVILPEWKVLITKNKNVLLQLKKEEHTKVNVDSKSEVKSNPIELSIFSNRFMSIAEQMGRVLQKTGTSTNIKERLDFSCALFGPKGNLVANAPHLPVHLGSMQECVKWQINNYKNWTEDEIILTNHPHAGGSHLPDINIITPVFHDGKPIFYVACRGHHADVGGITPGSMPPFSKNLQEEGIAAKTLVIVRDGQLLEQELIKFLTQSETSPKAPQQNQQKEQPQKTDSQPQEANQWNGRGTRTLQDNLSDLRAQIAANNQGVKLIKSLINEYSLKYVHAYMNFIQKNAENGVRHMLETLSKRNKMKEVDYVISEDYMDDGSKIRLKLTIDRTTKSAIFDFTGTGYEVLTNINCPRSVTMSAIIYCLRCLVDEEIPLNSGCLTPIDVIIPENSLLNPSENAPIEQRTQFQKPSKPAETLKAA
ncbi:hypothetical protein PPERSA_01483 [Pseudocohnilembus persalinus]|uniref:5-oxoprolinase n=1 Tax=Pseudocohnilembus persalinus TaxID=266149 RepID=A0A0V0QHE2_PSEPJ|nr:hypothetical protein PPERSA_01483 [Pseudocohnilembus persalinus]|eukprot:KRX01580.1 hypothetical protein PPERSA_01483 [Pseudocohnilembus persalinus]